MKINEHLKVNLTIVEIFKTNVNNQRLASMIISDLNQLYPEYRINFDLEDCDNILRIEDNGFIDILGVVNYGKKNNVNIKLIV
tara:strand:+ start:14085 stop:14333 length:249 start_codon:yes stop_codon:yes gene_type:complete